jgi:hypothetical protein
MRGIGIFCTQDFDPDFTAGSRHGVALIAHDRGSCVLAEFQENDVP